MARGRRGIVCGTVPEACSIELPLASPAYPHPSSPTATAVMRANRSKDTHPEIRLRSALHGHGLRFRKSYAVQSEGMRVRIDIAFPRRRIAVFVDGCFWHSCPTHGVRPAVNQQYWLPKLRRNTERDRRVDRFLVSAGWTVIRVWEHESADAVALRISQLITAC